MVDIQTVSIVSAAIGVLIAAVNSILTSRQANQQRQTELETRQVELFMRLYDRWNSSEYRQANRRIIWEWNWEDYDDWNEKYGPNSEAWMDFMTMATFIEGIGVLVQRGFINDELAYDLIGGDITNFWEKYGSICIERRKHVRPDLFDHTEMLYNRIKQIEKEQQKQ